jgi:hypothetical protein
MKTFIGEAHVNYFDKGETNGEKKTLDKQYIICYDVYIEIDCFNPKRSKKVMTAQKQIEDLKAENGYLKNINERLSEEKRKLTNLNWLDKHIEDNANAYGMGISQHGAFTASLAQLQENIEYEDME